MRQSPATESGPEGPRPRPGVWASRIFGDSDWSTGRGPIAFQIALSTGAILALELALIRWSSVQIRIFAYLNNIVLIGAFLGMGLGIALGRRYPRLVHGTLPALVLLALPLAFSDSLHLMHMPFPDSSVSLWGGEGGGLGILPALGNLAIFFGLFSLIVGVFLFAGAAVGQLFSRLPALRAYSADLVGSLVGIAVFTGATFLDAGPPVWLLIGGIAFVWLSRSVLSLAAFVVVVALGWFSVGDAVFSPYNRIDLHREGGGLMLRVNRDFHQVMLDLSDRHLGDPRLSSHQRARLRYVRQVYDIPFTINAHRGRALIVGAGSGNDTEAALRSGYRRVYSIDIDGRIIALGSRLHPEKPYGDKRVVPIVEDARAFFEQYRGEPFDVICYGLLDSHAMFSSLSSLRLDNFVYTEEGIRAAWRHVAPHGHLTLSFSTFAGPWIFDRLYWTIRRATGREVVALRHGLHYGVTFIVAGPRAELNLAGLHRFPRVGPRHREKSTITTSDDWPFLYLRPHSVPWGYLLVLGVIILGALVSIPFAYGRSVVRAEFDAVLFWMGAAFLLIETRSITSLSILFGSTWIVNSSVFFGVLTMVLAANLVVQRFEIRDPRPWFVGLLSSVAFLWFFDLAYLNHLPLAARGVIGGLITALPIGFAGVIVSTLLARSQRPTASLGSNILGAVVGGCCEYLSMFLGLTALVPLALCFYMLALFLFLRRGRAPAGELGLSPS